MRDERPRGLEEAGLDIKEFRSCESEGYAVFQRLEEYVTGRAKNAEDGLKGFVGDGEVERGKDSGLDEIKD